MRLRSFLISPLALVSVFSSAVAQAELIGYKETRITRASVQVQAFIDGHPTPVTIPPGQYVVVDVDVLGGFSHSIIFENSDGTTTRLKISDGELAKMTRPISSDDSGDGNSFQLQPNREYGGAKADQCSQTYVRAEATPEPLKDSGATQNVGLLLHAPSLSRCPRSRDIPTTVTTEDTRIMNFGSEGNPSLVMVQKVCERGFGGRCGWVQGDAVIPPAKQVAAALGTAPRGPGCDDQKNLSKHAEAIEQFVRHESLKDQRQAMATLKSKLGLCINTNQPLLKKDFEAKNPTGNLYDKFALSAVRNNYPGLSAKILPKNSGGGLSYGVTKEEFVAIDVLARTLYGEMSSGFNAQGDVLHCGDLPGQTAYMSVVAKVIRNRAELAMKSHSDYIRYSQKESIDRAEGAKPHDLADDHYRTEASRHAYLKYISGEHSSWRPDPISRVCLTDQQFSVWNHKVDGGAMSNLSQVMCPMQDKSARAKNAWENAVNTAMRAILDVPEFNKITQEIHGDVTQYRSNEKPGSKYLKTTPVVDQVPLTETGCVTTYSELPPSLAAKPAKKGKK